MVWLCLWQVRWCKMYWDLVDALFGDALETTLHVMMASVSELHTDPVTYVCSVFMTQGVMFCFTDVGVMPFVHKPDLVIAYDLMSKHQLRLALAICESMEMKNSFTCSTRMGAGFHVREISDNQHYIEARRVLSCVDRLLRRWNVDTMVAGIVMNRLLGFKQTRSTQLSHPVIESTLKNSNDLN